MADDLPVNISRVRVRMYHTDLVGGVFHGRIFELFEEARTEAFRRLGFEWRLTDDAGAAMVVTDVRARFLRPAMMDDLVQITVYVDALRKAQVLIGYEGRRDADGTLLFTGATNFAFVDRGRGRPVRVPRPLLDAINRCPGMLREHRDKSNDGAG
jgi:acyl-CoA thioester hydrolase